MNDEIYNSIRITSIASTIAKVMGVEPYEGFDKPNDIFLDKANEVFLCEKADRVFIYNPDAIGLWLFQKYTSMFNKALNCSNLSLPMLSVMPSVTPVCFASMYTGVMPDIHGIKSYVKPVITIETIFDVLIKAGKKVALVSTSNDSMSVIFLNRDMDYYIYDTYEAVNEKAFELIKKDEYDAIFVYNPNYDSTMHKFGPESIESMKELENNISFYSNAVDLIKKHWTKHNTFFGFLPDHGCHEIDGKCGSHGLDMSKDMNVIHFYGFNKAK